MDTHTQRGINMKNELENLKDRHVLDSNGQEIGRIREVEQEMRTGRYSTLHVEVDARNTQNNAELSGWHHLPLNTSDLVMDKDSARLCRTIESLNSQFTHKISVKKAQHSQRDFIDKSVTDRSKTPIGIAKDLRTSSDSGEFPTILVELNQDTKKRSSLEKVDWVRIKIDRVDEVGQEIRLDKPVEELSKEWSEIILHR